MSLQRDEAHVGHGSGKVILLGEHAVVHGVPALAAGLSKGSRAHARYDASPSPIGEAQLEISPWNVCVSRHDVQPLARAFDALLKARREGSEHATERNVSAVMEIPGGAGLGSSAALGVAVLRALDAQDGLTRGFEDAQRVALAWERVFHGNPSGVDTAMAISGGVAVYRRAPQEHEKSLTQLQLAKPLRLVVGHSGESGSTKKMVEQVAHQKDRDPSKFAQTLEAITAIVTNGTAALERGDHVALGRLFDMNQALLSTWLVSTDTLEYMCGVAREAGALGAKLTGGGGGGCMIALVDAAHGTAVKDALLALGHEAFEVTIESGAVSAVIGEETR